MTRDEGPQGSQPRKILIIEDEADIATSLKYNLDKEGGYAVTTAGSGERGLSLARQRPFDLIILDLMLPDMNGIEVCRALRAAPDRAYVPIIMLTARVEESDKLVGLEIGADDYVTKPFSMKELLARVRAHLRRPSAREDHDEPPFEEGGLRLDVARHLVLSEGNEVTLTRMEFALLAALVRQRGRVLSREFLLQKVWGYDYFGGSRTVDVHVRRLRRKLGRPGLQIETVIGIGYRFRGSGASPDEA
jgi:two-component system, OmpR family, alkaline phosphatase synthesis response regulator PhoP